MGHRESGVSATFVAGVAAVMVGVGLWVFGQSKGAIWENAHDSLAAVCFEALKANDPDKYVNEMMRVWDVLVEEQGYQSYYRRYVDIDDPEKFAAWKYDTREKARAVFVNCRTDTEGEIDWSSAEYAGPNINAAPVSVNRLVGFFVKAKGTTYEFKFVKPLHCLHFVSYVGIRE